MSRSAIEQMLYLLDEAFEATDEQEHSLLTNLASVTDADWHWKPLGGQRTIAQLAQHVGDCKFMYSNHGFGDGALTWEDFRNRWENLPQKDEMVAWLREGQALFRGYVASLDNDYELVTPRKAPWGREYETRWLIATIIEHDGYHAGEINHVRALAQKNDAWPWS
jgi:hypothetical protein